MLNVKATFKDILARLLQLNDAVKIEYMTETVKTGTTQYQGFYYVDKAITIPSGYLFLCVGEIKPVGNVFAHVMNMNWTFRIFSTAPDTNVTFTVFYYKKV